MQTLSETETKTCQRCGSWFEMTPFFLNGRRIESFDPKNCEECNEILINEFDRDALLRAREASRNRFLSQVPTIYQQTDKTRISPKLVAAVDSWDCSSGVGMVGKSGRGKTRAGILMLIRAAEDCRECMFLPCTEFSNACSDQFSDDSRRSNEASDLLYRAKRVPFLLLDDLGKNRMTDRAEATLYELLECRTSNMRTTIWTSNSNGRELLPMFSPDRADAILRRLIEFSTIVTL